MIEPHRLLQKGATDAERALLKSARADGPAHGAAQRTLAALDGLTAGSGSMDAQGSGHALGNPLPNPGAPTAAHALQLGTLAKVVALVGLGALGAGALVHLIDRQRSVSGTTSAGHAPVMQEVPVAGNVESPRAHEGPTLEAASEASTPVQGSGSTPRHRQTNATDASLSAEVRSLDAARAALDDHNPAAAQRVLDSYAQRFPQGHLKPEATVLRLTVLVRQGNRAAAKSLAAQLLASESYKAYDYRIRSLLRETEE